MRKKQAGSAILWAMIVGMIFSLLLVAILGTSFAAFNRNVHKVGQEQAYLTARSGAETVAEVFFSYPNNHDILLQLPANSPVSVGGLDFPAEMGHCTVTVERTADWAVYIQAQAEVAGYRSEVGLTVGMTPVYASYIKDYDAQGQAIIDKALSEVRGQIIRYGRANWQTEDIVLPLP